MGLSPGLSGGSTRDFQCGFQVWCIPLAAALSEVMIAFWQGPLGLGCHRQEVLTGSIRNPRSGAEPHVEKRAVVEVWGQTPKRPRPPKLEPETQKRCAVAVVIERTENGKLDGMTEEAPLTTGRSMGFIRPAQ